MQVYTYNEAGYYSGIHDCQKCPKTKNWLYPARYTDSPPPELIKNKMVRMVKNKWVQEYNYIGIDIWEKETGEKSICKTEIIPDGFTDIEKPIEPYYFFDNIEWLIDETKKTDYEKEIKKSRLLFELQSLDMKITRPVENTIEFLIEDGKIFDKKVIEVIDEKKKVRKEYTDLLI